MKQKVILAILVVVLLMTTVVSSYAVTWYRVRTWSNQYVLYHRFYCNTLPVYTGYTAHRVLLRPINNDVDLYLYGYSSSWHYIGGSANNGLNNDSVTFGGAIRRAYHTIIACGYGYSGSSYFHLYYYVGT